MFLWNLNARDGFRNCDLRLSIAFWGTLVPWILTVDYTFNLHHWFRDNWHSWMLVLLWVTGDMDSGYRTRGCTPGSPQHNTPGLTENLWLYPRFTSAQHPRADREPVAAPPGHLSTAPPGWQRARGCTPGSPQHSTPGLTESPWLHPRVTSAQHPRADREPVAVPPGYLSTAPPGWQRARGCTPGSPQHSTPGLTESPWLYPRVTSAQHPRADREPVAAPPGHLSTAPPGWQRARGCTPGSPQHSTPGLTESMLLYPRVTSAQLLRADREPVAVPPGHLSTSPPGWQRACGCTPGSPQHSTPGLTESLWLYPRVTSAQHPRADREPVAVPPGHLSTAPPGWQRVCGCTPGSPQHITPGLAESLWLYPRVTSAQHPRAGRESVAVPPGHLSTSPPGWQRVCGCTPGASHICTPGLTESLWLYPRVTSAQHPRDDRESVAVPPGYLSTAPPGWQRVCGCTPGGHLSTAPPGWQRACGCTPGSPQHSTPGLTESPWLYPRVTSAHHPRADRESVAVPPGHLSTAPPGWQRARGCTPGLPQHITPGLTESLWLYPRVTSAHHPRADREPVAVPPGHLSTAPPGWQRVCGCTPGSPQHSSPGLTESLWLYPRVTSVQHPRADRESVAVPPGHLSTAPPGWKRVCGCTPGSPQHSTPGLKESLWLYPRVTSAQHPRAGRESVAVPPDYLSTAPPGWQRVCGCTPGASHISTPGLTESGCFLPLTRRYHTNTPPPPSGHLPEVYVTMSITITMVTTRHVQQTEPRTPRKIHRQLGKKGEPPWYGWSKGPCIYLFICVLKPHVFMYLFIHSYIHSYINPFIHLFFYNCIHHYTNSFIHSFSHFFKSIHSLIPLFDQFI